MAKEIPTQAFLSIGGTSYYMIEITANFDIEKGDVTDGNTPAGGREFIAGRATREITGKLWIDMTSAEPAEGATGAVILTAKPAGSTAKSYSWTNGTIFNKSLNINAAGSEGFFATYTIAVDGATTAAQYT